MNNVSHFIVNHEALVIIMGVCFIHLACLTCAVYPEIKTQMKALWERIVKRLSRAPLVSGDIIAFEAAVNEPVNLNNKEKIESLGNEILRNGFDNNLEVERFISASESYHKKYDA